MPDNLSQQDIQDLQDISSHLPAGHPHQQAISKLISSQPTQFEQERNPNNQPGFLESAGHTALDMGKSMFGGGQKPGVTASDIAGPGVGLAKSIYSGYKGARERGHGAGYSAAAGLATPLGVDVPGMEHNADVGNAAGIAGQAAVPAAAAVAPLGVEGAVRGAKSLGGEIRQYGVHAPEGLKLPGGFRIGKAEIPEPTPPGPVGNPTSPKPGPAPAPPTNTGPALPSRGTMTSTGGEVPTVGPKLPPPPKPVAAAKPGPAGTPTNAPNLSLPDVNIPAPTGKGPLVTTGGTVSPVQAKPGLAPGGISTMGIDTSGMESGTPTGKGPMTSTGGEPPKLSPTPKKITPKEDVAILPEPRDPSPTDKPGLQYSVKRKTELVQGAKMGRPGAGDVLQQLKPTLYEPREGVGYPGPRQESIGTPLPPQEPAPVGLKQRPPNEVYMRPHMSKYMQAQSPTGTVALPPEVHAELERQAGRPLTPQEANYMDRQSMENGMVEHAGDVDEASAIREKKRAQLEQPDPDRYKKKGK